MQVALSTCFQVLFLEFVRLDISFLDVPFVQLSFELSLSALRFAIDTLKGMMK